MYTEVFIINIFLRHFITFPVVLSFYYRSIGASWCISNIPGITVKLFLFQIVPSPSQLTAIMAHTLSSLFVFFLCVWVVETFPIANRWMGGGDSSYHGKKVWDSLPILVTCARIPSNYVQPVIDWQAVLWIKLSKGCSLHYSNPSEKY